MLPSQLSLNLEASVKALRTLRTTRVPPCSTSQESAPVPATAPRAFKEDIKLLCFFWKANGLTSCAEILVLDPPELEREPRHSIDEIEHLRRKLKTRCARHRAFENLEGKFIESEGVEMGMEARITKEDVGQDGVEKATVGNSCKLNRKEKIKQRSIAFLHAEYDFIEIYTKFSEECYDTIQLAPTTENVSDFNLSDEIFHSSIRLITMN